jgi:hypothetical protein
VTNSAHLKVRGRFGTTEGGSSQRNMKGCEDLNLPEFFGEGALETFSSNDLLVVQVHQIQPVVQVF